METKTANYLAFRASQIPVAIDNALERSVNPDTGEIVDENALAEVESLVKLQSVTLADLGQWVLWAENERLGEIKRLMERLKHEKDKIERAAEACRRAIRANLPEGEKVVTDWCKISWRSSVSVEVTCKPEDLPPAFQRVKVEPMKNELKAALKSGEVIEGARLIQSSNLVIQ